MVSRGQEEADTLPKRVFCNLYGESQKSHSYFSGNVQCTLSLKAWQSRSFASLIQRYTFYSRSMHHVPYTAIQK